MDKMSFSERPRLLNNLLASTTTEDVVEVFVVFSEVLSEVIFGIAV